MGMEVIMKEIVTVRPSDEQLNRQTIELSGLDRISPAILYTIFFYKSKLEGESSYYGADDRIHGARKALSQVLVSWYPAAGRFKYNEITGKLEIDCNNEGVIMATAVTDSTIKELGQLSEYKPCYEKLVPKLPEGNDISQNPLVLIQITRFGCGGISIGFGGSHALFDGVGAFNFLKTWAYISSGKDHQPNLIIPNHSRNTLLHSISDSLNTSPKPSHSSIYEQDHIGAIKDLYGIPMQSKASDDRSWETALSKLILNNPQAGDVVLVTLKMKKEVVEACKGVAITKGKLSRCSTFDVLCAHVWKARVRALMLPQDTNICLQFPVNARSKLRPPLGENFTGNAFVLASVSCLVKDLLEEPFHQTIHKIQAAKDAITNEYIKSYAKALDESSDKFFPSMRELTIVTDWLKFPFDVLDFGWGGVSGASLLATPVPETAFLMLNLEEPGGFLLRIGIGRQYVDELVSIVNDFTKST